MTEERQRLWEHRLHEDHIFSDRQNYFLLAESMLAIAFTTAFGIDKRFVSYVISAAGMLITIGWLYVNWRQRRIVSHVHRRALDALPEFAETWRTRPTARLASSSVLAYAMPGFLGAMWTLLLAATAFEWG
jgi:hypothetical protein